MSFKSMSRIACVLLVSVLVPSVAYSATILNVRICQGVALCTDFGPSAGPGPFVNSNVVIGDFRISGSVSSNEDPAGSNAATTTISVQRVSTNLASSNLDIWLSASNYTLPDITSGYVFATTASFTSSLTNESVPVSFQGWLSPGNIVAYPPAGLTPGSNGCTLDAGTADSCAAAIGLLTSSVGVNPFTMTTQTTFNIAQASTSATYTSNAQANITPVPEPSSLFLLGGGLLFGAYKIRKMRREARMEH